MTAKIKSSTRRPF